MSLPGSPLLWRESLSLVSGPLAAMLPRSATGTPVVSGGIETAPQPGGAWDVPLPASGATEVSALRWSASL